jgi:ABC-type uncharacterized transport system substrate-binding protein
MVRVGALATLTARHAVPALYAFRENAVAGGLMSYGADFLKPTRELSIYVGRILNGEKPADLPVRQASKIEFVINLKTAKALGINGATTIARPRHRGHRAETCREPGMGLTTSMEASRTRQLPILQNRPPLA